MVKNNDKVNVISKALSFLDNGKFNRNIFKKFNFEIQNKKIKKSMYN